MTALVLALYAEGPTDVRFLPILIRRTVERLLARQGRMDVDVLDVIVMSQDIQRRCTTQVERLVEAARMAAGYHGLIVHADADGPTRNRALDERLAPGFAAIRSVREKVCMSVVPLIPIHMVEAWMLADAEAFRRIIGANVDARHLGLPAAAREIEADADPKATLSRAVQIAFNTRRRQRHFEIPTIFEPLAQILRLEQLDGLSAYQQFQRDILQLLVDVQMVNSS